MIIDYKIVGMRISLLRKKQKMTQEQLAEITELSIVYISSIENARKSPTLETFVSIANALGCTMDDLLDGFLVHKGVPFSNFSALLADCSPREKLLIYSIIHAIKEPLRMLL